MRCLFLGYRDWAIQVYQSIKNNPNISKFIELSISLQYGFIFFDESFNEISKDKFVELTSNVENFTLSICQCSPD